MKLRHGIMIALGLALIVAITAFASRIAEHYHNDLPGGRFELGRVKLTKLDEATQQRLAALTHDVLITYYVSAREEMPSEMRRIERDVTDLLSAMQRASAGRLDFQIVDPAQHEMAAGDAAHQRVAPFRMRSISRDAYSERTVWSTLHIAYGPHEPVVINGISPAHVSRLQSLILGQLKQKDQPRRAVYGIAGPPVYTSLANWLQAEGEVVHVDLDDDQPIPEDVDVLFWLDPQGADAAAVRQLQQFLESGRSAIIAGSRHEVVQQDGRRMSLQPTTYDPEFLLAPFGVSAVDGLVLDEMSQSVPGEVAPMPARFLVRCIPPNQDFREMGDLPNGHLLFAAPTPLQLEHDVLAQRGLAPTVLATTSDRTMISDMNYGEVNLASEAYHAGDPVPKLPLMLWLRPNERWRGSLIISASSSLFRDGAFEAEGLAHRRLMEVLTSSLAADERLVIHSADFAEAASLPPVSAAGRLLWRVICIGVFPALIGIIAWRRGAFVNSESRSKQQQARKLRAVVVFSGLFVAVTVLVAMTPTWRIDLTVDRTNQLSRETRIIAQQSVDEHAIELTLYVSPSQHLPPDVRPMIRRLHAMLDELKRTGANIIIQQVYPEELSQQRRDELQRQGVKPVRIQTHDEDRTVVRTVYSTVELRGSNGVQTLHFPDRASFELLEFRLAAALWRLHTGRQPHIAFASDVPRLSAAEAYHDFQQRQLLAPSGTDVYSHARAMLEQADFLVTHINPRNPHMPDNVDLIIWMQPRRDVLAMLELATEQLHQGVPVLIAAQQFNMQARQYRGAGFETVYWPQPQVVDLHLHYLPDIGVQLVHEVLFDELHGEMELQTQVNRASGERDYEMQASALPFLIRASAANFAHHPSMRNLGDQLLPFPSYVKLDGERLDELNISATTLMSTSERSWTYNWTGGWIPEAMLARPPLTESQQPQWQGRLPLAVLLEGVFPMPLEPLTTRRSDTTQPVTLSDQPGQSSKLVLLGCSEMFKNHRLRDDAFRADHLLMNVVAHLALDENLASIASHRNVPRGFGYVEADRRLYWRVIVLASSPLLMVLWAGLWFTFRTMSGRRYQP